MCERETLRVLERQRLDMYCMHHGIRVNKQQVMRGYREVVCAMRVMLMVGVMRGNAQCRVCTIVRSREAMGTGRP